MRSQRHSVLPLTAPLWCAALLLTGAVATAAPLDKPATDQRKTDTSVAAVRPIPKSEFTIPKTPAEGRNPFFPTSSEASAVKTPADPQRTLTPKLNGLGGTPQQKLAIINNRTFAEGEEGDISFGSLKARIRLVEIKETSVVIEMAGERKELQLGSGN